MQYVSKIDFFLNTFFLLSRFLKNYFPFYKINYNSKLNLTCYSNLFNYKNGFSYVLHEIACNILSPSVHRFRKDVSEDVLLNSFQSNFFSFFNYNDCKLLS